MEKNTTAILLIILGLIVLAFPLVGLVPLSLIVGFGVAFLGLGLLFAGAADVKESSGLGLLEIIMGILALILGLGFIVNPSLFSFVAGLLVYIAGLFLVIIGIVSIFTKAGGSRWNGVIGIVIGLIYLVIGVFISNPYYLGILIGLWLLLLGIMTFFQED
jgi:membrane protein HdeD